METTRKPIAFEEKCPACGQQVTIIEGINYKTIISPHHLPEKLGATPCPSSGEKWTRG